MNGNVLFRLITTALTASLLLPSAALAAKENAAPPMESRININGYSNIVIPDIQNDPDGIGPALREEAKERGLIVSVDGRDIPEIDLAKTCVVAWGWTRVRLASGTIQMRIYDALSHDLVVEAHSSYIAVWTVHGAVKQGVRKGLDETGFAGYSEEQHRKNVNVLFPARPKIEFGEKGFQDHPPTSDIEGLWSAERNEYTVAITNATPTREFDYVGVIVSTSHALWSPGEIKMEFKKTAAPTAFVGNYYPANKKRQGTMYTLEGGRSSNSRSQDRVTNKSTPTSLSPGPRRKPKGAIIKARQLQGSAEPEQRF